MALSAHGTLLGGSPALFTSPDHILWDKHHLGVICEDFIRTCRAHPGYGHHGLRSVMCCDTCWGELQWFCQKQACLMTSRAIWRPCPERHHRPTRLDLTMGSIEWSLAMKDSWNLAVEESSVCLTYSIFEISLEFNEQLREGTANQL